MPQPRHRSGDDRLGFEETTNYLTSALSKFVPNWLARRAVSVSVETPRDRYRRGEPVEIVVEFRNRLPLPITVPTVERRLWEWRVDGVLEATEEPRYVDRSPNTFAFRGGERKRVVQHWNGHFRRAEGIDGLHASKPATPGEHTISVSLTTTDGDGPGDATTITVE
ncbi:hypothetical protein [Halalkalicoccus jeotgali]|uniref:DUF7974 domain-containing protein n=1 Tax=Halalkalicoccus jeotgali (strain DSM 18796 / CECT 7217 / JCM 14584 / KCTC 4019 / B3) TaxID=795797 RepID=D8J569_HALJB|nr:hypothetical protein [Halalkalicoccus jeotgali]ADJ13650.1 hypothetical protein HacjB3_01285 [Halalkalicoccus jeotgali B3]ELY33329.1 hypothetical protein C497_18052 [Halalkalicoccus jeotgali B3]